MIEFIYKILQPCGHLWVTKKPEVAEKASKNGCFVTCVAIGNDKFYKHLKHKHTSPQR